MMIGISAKEAELYLRGDFDKREAMDPMEKRRQRILIAGALNLKPVLKLLGSQESMTFADGRYLASFGEDKNPYRGERQ